MKWAHIRILLLSLIFLVGTFILVQSYTQKTPDNPYTHSYTKAICDTGNFCGDYEIFCKNEEFIEMKFTGAAVQFPSEWKDPRDEETIKRNC